MATESYYLYLNGTATHRADKGSRAVGKVHYTYCYSALLLHT